ncbi:hypothetical protein [Oceanicella sp. SM1341]|uniref:hypothetical protein n=1 Tax=Oceanicella sp. SM1341 TaxID=1548889 RepID=UPI000E46E6D2|nr:hypothetical protein [Oceanicella sp. SM1341]
MPEPAPEWFRAPERRFRTAAFWFWHRLPERGEIDAGLQDMARAGIGAVLVQGRLALPRADWLSGPWCEALAHASERARRVGIGVEIYDDYNWISGQGAGRTVEGAGHLRERLLFWSTGPAGAPLSVSGIRFPFLGFLGPVGQDWLYEGGRPAWDEWEIVRAVARGPDGTPRDVTAAARLTAAGPEGAEAVVEGDGEVTVFLAARCATSRLINYLMPEAAERYAQAVCAPMLAASGGRAEASFFDHPHAGFYTWDQQAGAAGNALLWDARLGPALERLAPLASVLAALTGAAGPGTEALRARAWEVYGNRLHEAFFGTLSRWWAARGVAFSGHELLCHVGGYGLRDGLSGFDARVMPGLDYFGIDAWRAATTADAADYAPQLSARMGDSVARASGRSRCTVEQYSTGRESGIPGGAGNWGLTPARLRAQMLRHVLSGARRVTLHALWLDAGREAEPVPFLNPRFDFPPGFNLQPWWEDMPALGSECARVSAFLEEGVPERPVALLYPLWTLRAAGAAPPACCDAFGLWAGALDRAGVGWQVIDHRALAAARLEGDTLVTPAGRFSALVLPGAEVLESAKEAALIAAFRAAGGRVLASAPLPARTLDGAEPGDLAERCDTPEEIAARGRALAGLMALHPGTLPNCVLRDGAGWKLVLFNDTDAPLAPDIALPPGPWAVRDWDAQTGDIGPARLREGRLRLHLPAGACACLALAPREQAGAMPGDGMSATAASGLVAAASGAAGQPLSGAGPAGARAAAGREAARPVGPAWARGPDAQREAPLLAPPGPVTESRALEEGWELALPAGAAFRPVSVRAGWERQGGADFAGTGLYRLWLELPEPGAGLGWELELPGFRHSGTLRFAGGPVLRHLAGEARFPLHPGSGWLELSLRNTGANRYYAGTPWQPAGPEPGGLARPPLLHLRRA